MNDKIKYCLHKMKKSSLTILMRYTFCKFKTKVSGIFDKFLANIFDTEIANKKFLKEVWHSESEFKNAGELGLYLRNREEPKFIIDLLKREKLNSFIRKHFPDISSKTTYEADKICNHVFNLLGSGDVNLGGKIDWHRDFKSGYRWNPRKYYRDIEIPFGRADIKVPWELSRFQHINMLGEAYWLTNDKKYAKEFVNQIDDWIENNKPKFGVNWRCTMDVAIRVCNWILGYIYFKNSPEINDEFLLRFLKSLYQHGKHIIANLEWRRTFTSNHYLSDIAGLVYLGIIFPEFKDAAYWRKFGIQELTKEMQKQIYPDGCDFEASTCYHRLVLELLFFSTLMVVINEKDFKGDNFPEVAQEVFGKEYVQKLYKMFEFVLYALKPNGKMPQIGDNDNGRLHMFGGGHVLDMRYLLTLGAIFFREPKFKVKEFGFCEEAIWVFGESGYKIWQDLQENCLANVGSKAFPDAGWYIMRNNKDYCIISCGPNGQNGNGGHCHNDKLSFELHIDGEDIIVDPGTYVYTSDPEARNRFRGTACHNTIVIDGKEQNDFNKNKLFYMSDESKVKIRNWKIDEKYDFLDAEHYGYKRLKGSVIHRRQIKFDKKQKLWIVGDALINNEKHMFNWHFHFNAGVEVKPLEALAVKAKSQGGSSLLLYPFETKGMNLSIITTWISSVYGMKDRASLLKYSTSSLGAFTATYLLMPLEKNTLLSNDRIKQIIRENLVVQKCSVGHSLKQAKS